MKITRSISGLVVKSIVAIDGPRVRFAADALHVDVVIFFILRFLTRSQSCSRRS
ncbi:hypothetical protein QBC46DRAFT_379385 [Diplogelasinospora grovesii]|uniref:Uncharacterized protein n=1 Tax=Diplogelasinospora grovesii TaxID=303347 RepID=A0AAN6S7D0_9PEZI|nr:hypothetical protein QBC46DRAFT_379385 [Diplogelasinospora grovesii]